MELCYETIQYSPFIEEQVADLPAQIRGAAAAGFDWIGIDIASIRQHCQRGGSLPQLRELLEASGLGFFELQDLTISDDDAATLERAQELLEVCRVMRPRWVQAGVQSVSETAVANASRAAAVLEAVGVPIALEFLPFLPVCDIASARDFIARAELPGARIVVDTWHFTFGPDRWEDLEALPLAELAYVQFDDHPPLASDDLMEETCHRRVLPGEGGFELDRFCRVLRDKGYDAPVSVEILSRPLRGLAPEVFAQRVHDAAAPFWS